MNSASANRLINNQDYIVFHICEWNKSSDCHQEILHQALSQDHSKWKHVVVDCTGLDYANSLFIAFLIQIATETKNRGGDFCLSGLNGFINDLIQVTHLDERWQIYESLDQAEQDLK